jgi:hypothetical protein
MSHYYDKHNAMKGEIMLNQPLIKLFFIFLCHIIIFIIHYSLFIIRYSIN